MEALNVGSTFSGIGGLDLGLERAGMRHLFFAESWQFARDVLAHRFPGVPIYEDVRHVDRLGDEWAWNIDLLAGGFPCTDLSIAGRRAGLAGDASGLFYEFARIAESLRPRWLLVENVPGLFSSPGRDRETRADRSGADFGVVLHTLADIGYGVAWRTCDSRYFGVPQRRRRVFIVGALIDGDPRAAAERAGEVLGVGTRCARHPRTREEERSDAAGLAAPGAPEDGGGDDTYYVEGAPNATLRANGDGGARTDKQPLVVAPVPSGSGGGRRMDADTLTHLIPEVSEAVTAKWRKGSGGPSGDETQNLITYNVQPAGRGQSADLEISESDLSPALDANRNERGTLAVTFAENQRGELRESDIAMQLTAGGGKPGDGYAGVREGLRVRRLTPKEAERLQALPDDWTLPTGKEADTNRYASIGNAVTVTVAQWIGERMIRVDASH